MHIPASTYRLQFHRGFRFEDAQRLIPYLHRLGITDLYASPLFRARSGSPHGYDVTDPTQWNPELGTPAAFAQLCDELHRHRMSLLLDIVPNHMAATLQNPWWRNLLESGVDSPFANWFDIDWRPGRHSAGNRVVLPVLGSPPGRVLDRGELSLSLGEYGFLLCYFDHEFPLALRSYAHLLNLQRDELARRLDAHHPVWKQLDTLQLQLTRFGRRHAVRTGELPDAQTQMERAAEIRRTIWRLFDEYEPVRLWLQSILAQFNRRDHPAARRNLERLLAEQPYRLVWWRSATREINYRRFFAISELVSLKIDQPAVFAATHTLVKEWIDAGRIQGLRVDHIDGLNDPALYLQQLRQLSPRMESVYLTVEKILERDESLPSDWPVQGTTGYDFLNLAHRLFVDAEGYRRLRQSYRQFIRRQLHFKDVVYGKRRQAMVSFFGGEIDGLTRRVKAMARLQQSDPGLSVHHAATAFEELTACLPVYRTYIRDHEVSAADREAIDGAAESARPHAPEVEAAAWNWVRALLQVSPAAGIPPQHHAAWLALVQRWQQYTGPIMAKGHEDAALYVYVPLTSLNEVGGDPSAGPLSPAGFHQAMQQRVQHWPHTMNASSTHDTKRSEDVRARLNVLSEIPVEWRRAVERWSAWNRPYRSLLRGRPAPDRNTEYLFYQSLIGALPMEWVRRTPNPDELERLRQRMHDYMRKAAREAKVQTRWTEPNVGFESALARFVEAIFAAAPRDPFFSDVLRLLRMIAPVGAVNSLSQLLLKLTAPGVPDLYQGTELWNLFLVDPDNRQPVDFDRRISLLAEVREGPLTPRRINEWLLRWPEGAIKIFVLHKGLCFRRENAALFAEGEYLPLPVEGELHEHICAYLRHHERSWSLTVVPLRIARWMLGQSTLAPISWGDTRLVLPADAPTVWHSVWTGHSISIAPGRLPISDALGELPIGLLQARVA